MKKPNDESKYSTRPSPQYKFRDLSHRLLVISVLLPDSIADTYWHLHTQPRNAWTLDLDLRPWKEMAWFNS